MDSGDIPLRGERGRSVSERFENRIVMSVPDRHNPTLQRLMRLVNQDDELYALWLASNVTGLERLGMTDHGPVHIKIVMNIAIRMLRLLVDGGVEPAVVQDYAMDPADAEIVVALAAMLHDVGMSIHRDDHEAFSLFIAQDKLREYLRELYDIPTATVIRAEVLHAIIGHRADGKPLTIEAGVVRIADALDMSKGRSRVPIEAGSTSIHSISAAAIERVSIEAGDEKPIRLSIRMNNSAGIFQLDQLFRRKLGGSGLEKFIEVEATLEGEAEKKLFTEFYL